MSAWCHGLNIKNYGRQTRLRKREERGSGKLNASELCAWRVHAALLGKTHICLHWRVGGGTYNYCFPVTSDPNKLPWNAGAHGYTLESVEFRDSL